MMRQDSLTLPALTLRALRRCGDRVVFSGHGGSMTGRQALDRVGRYQAAFAAAGMRRGQRMALLNANRADAWLANVAAQGLGLCTTALHPLGALEDQLFILEDGEIDHLLVDVAAYGERGGALSAGAAGLEACFTLGPAEYGQDLAAAAEAVGAASPQVQAAPEDAVMLGYTGGTTGKSKGALRRHPSMVALANAVLADFEWPAGASYLAVAPISHVGGTKLLPTLLRGGRTHFHHGFDPDRILHDIAAERIGVALFVPTMIYMLLDHPGLDAADLSSLEMLLYGASPMSPTRLVEGLERIGPVFVQLYGQTECYPISVLGRGDHDPAHPERFASCGFPCSSVDLSLLDEDNRPVAPGAVGEISVRAPQMMEAYWQREEQTAETLSGGWLHTGDMARADEEGFLYIVDRKKDMIISGGFNIFPREIEDILTAHPDVAMAAVIGVPDEKWGEAVRAVVVPRPGRKPDPEALIAAVKARKGSHEAPKAVDFAEEIPLTAIGKPDKKQLRERYWQDRERRVG